MTENHNNPHPVPSSRDRARRLRITAVIVLLLGAIGVGVVYWLASKDVPDDTLLVGYYKSQQLQLEKMYGEQGVLVSAIYNSLKQPGTQAIIIIVIALLIAGVCLFFAKVFDHDGSR